MKKGPARRNTRKAISSPFAAPGKAECERCKHETRFMYTLLSTQQETSIEGILVVDGNQKIISFNRRFAEIWGIPDEVLKSRSDERALSHVISKLKDPEGFMALVQRLYAHRDEKSLDEIELKDDRTLERYSAGMTGPDGEYFGRVWYFRDITRRKRAEWNIRKLNDELMDAVARLKAANRDLEAFAYSVSHDLRTPLRHMLTFMKYLEEEAGAGLGAEARKHLNVVTASAKKMDLLIRSLLAFSKVSRAVPEIIDFSGRELVEEAVNDVREDVPAGRGITWHVGDIPVLRGDRKMLRQVLLNLLENAVKYSRGKEPAVIEVFSRKEGRETVIGVRDNGVGFDMKLKEGLFGVFRRLHSEDEFEGTGIGLANVKSVVLKHGGRVWAESAPGRETIFYFSLPSPETVDAEIRNGGHV